MSDIKRRCITLNIQRPVQVTLLNGRVIAGTRIVAFEDDVLELIDGSFFSLPQIASIEPLDRELSALAPSSPVAAVLPTPAPFVVPLREARRDPLDLEAHQPIAREQPIPDPMPVVDAIVGRAHTATAEPFRELGLAGRDIKPQFERKAALFVESLTGYVWEPSPVPPLSQRSVPKMPTSTYHSDTAKHHWSRAINLLGSHNLREVINEFLCFSALVPSAIEPLWGAAFVAEQQGDPIKALALLQWRPHLLASVPELLHATVSLAHRLRLPETMLRLLHAHARPPVGLLRDYLLLACSHGMYRKIVVFLDEYSAIDSEFEESLLAHLLLCLLDATPALDTGRMIDSSPAQLLAFLVQNNEDIPTQEYLSQASNENEIVERIRRLHDEFRDSELATRERFSLGPSLRMVQEERRQLDFSQARLLADSALARAESSQWRQAFQEQLRQIDAEFPRARPAPRPSQPLRGPSRARPSHRSETPLWQQAAEAAAVGQSNRAIELYLLFLKEAVSHNVWPERADPALNALAVVYNRIGQRQRAIDVMLTYRDKVQARFRFHNQLATLYFLVGDYLKSAEEFQLAVGLATNTLERQKAQKNVQKARQRAQLGERVPDQTQKVASMTDSFERELEREYLAIGIDAGIKMPEVTLAIDPFLQPDLERLTENGDKIVGIDRGQVARKEFNYQTIKNLDQRSQKEQTTQGFRSQYLASALWLVYSQNWHQSDEAQEQLPDLRVLQTRFAASLGDDAAAQGRNDIAREYYAFVLERNPNEALALAKVRDYLRTMTGERFVPGKEKWQWEELRKLLDGVGPGLEKGARITCWAVVHIAGLSTAAYNAVLRALDNESIRQALVTAMAKHIPGMRDANSDFNTALATGVSLLNTHQERIVEQFKRFEAAGFDLQALAKPDVGDPLVGFDTDLPHNTPDFGDAGRILAWRRNLLPAVGNYLVASSPSEKELRYEVADNSIDLARKALLEYPTRFGRRVLLLLLERLRDDLRAHFEEWKPTAAPQVDVQIEDVRGDRVNSGTSFELDVLILNAPHCRAAQDVQLELEIPDWSLTCEYSESGGLDGGARKSQRWLLQKRRDVQSPASVTAVAALTYRVDGYEIRARQEVDVSLRTIHYQRWRSPYHPGPPVLSDMMLKGRETIVATLTDGVADEDRYTFFRILGPKRIGKSSIVEAVFRRLMARRDPRLFVTARFDLKLAGASSLGQLLSSWATHIQHAAYDAGVTLPPFHNDPSQLATYQFLRWLEDSVRPVGHVVFLVDEFQSLATMFDDRTLVDFLGFWKALIERCLISGILCGIDSMDEWIAKRGFGNQFASLQTVQISYLDDGSASKLVEDPVRLPEELPLPFDNLRGHSRYTPGAVKRILDLAGGSPFFIHYVCDDIVKHLNSAEVRGMLVTEMIVKMVAQKFVDTTDFVTHFESVTVFTGSPKAHTPGDPVDIEGRLFATIALATLDSHSYCDMHEKIRLWPKHHQGIALETMNRLERNKVLECDARGAHHRIRVGLLRLWFQRKRPYGEQLAPES